MILYHPTATHHASFTGGILSSPTQHPNSQTGPCAAPTPLISVFVMRIICQIILTWLSWNSTSMILRESFVGNLTSQCRLMLCGIGSERPTMENFELLVRSILLRDDQPAILILGHFSPQVHQESGFGGPEIWHNIVAQFYDVPHVRYILFLSLLYCSSAQFCW